MEFVSAGGTACADCFSTDPANLETCLGAVDGVGSIAAPPTARCARAVPHCRGLTCSVCDITGCGVSRVTGQRLSDLTKARPIHIAPGTEPPVWTRRRKYLW